MCCLARRRAGGATATVCGNKCAPQPVSWWALRESNPRPSPCKGETNLLVRALIWGNALSLSTAEYLAVPSARYADVMQGAEGKPHSVRVVTRSLIELRLRLHLAPKAGGAADGDHGESDRRSGDGARLARAFRRGRCVRQ